MPTGFPLPNSIGATTRRTGIPLLATIVTIALAPIGIYGPLEWVWTLPLIAAIVAVAIRPPSRSALIDVGLLLGFIALGIALLPGSDARRAGAGMAFALMVAAAVYLVGRQSADDPGTVATVRRVGVAWLWLLGAGLVVHAMTGIGADGLAYGYPVRHAAMATVPMLAIALSARRGHRVAVAGGLLAAAGALATGSRTASVVLVLVLAADAALRWSTRARVVAAVGLMAAVVVAITVPGFQDRWFGNEIDEPFRNLDQLAIDVGGRPAVWRDVIHACDPNLLVGSGLGSSNRIAARLHPGFPDPHNEFIRFGCDTGVAGSALLWGFFGFAGIRTIRLLRRRPGHRIGWSALLGLGSLLAFSLVWNPVTAVEFTAPLMLLLAWSDHSYDRIVQDLPDTGSDLAHEA